MIDICDLLGVPYVLHGRDLKGFDCYGFLIEFERRLGHQMIDLHREYSENSNKDLNDNVHNIVYANKLKKTETPVMGDILLFYDNKGRVCHIGAFLKNDDFIHCDCNGVQISKLSTYHRKAEAYTWLN